MEELGRVGVVDISNNLSWVKHNSIANSVDSLVLQYSSVSLSAVQNGDVRARYFVSENS